MYASIEPYATGMLDVGDGNLIHWEVSGNPDGKPAVAVHGGPGSGSSPWRRRFFDPARYRIVQFDQRGCGRSIPSAAEIATDMRHNTTWHLTADMERLREHLGIDRWLMLGGSWGSTLILAYAQQHPRRVSEIVIPAVTMSRRDEIDWLYRGVARYFPAQWEEFRENARADDVVAAYARLAAHPDLPVREKATLDWCAWEDAVLSGETSRKPYGDRPAAAKRAFVRICTHYFAHAAWLEEGALLRNASRLTGIPGVLIHGRLDMGGPLKTAWELHRAWPGSRLHVVENAGHLGNDETSRLVVEALDEFAG